jgi:hypothetical protein
MSVDEPVFVPRYIAGKDLFRLPFRASSTYASEEFVRRVGLAELVGLEFREIWTDD